MDVTLAAAVRHGVERALSERRGRPTRIARVTRVGGGCISLAARVEAEGGYVMFLKWSQGASTIPGLFAEEARSLRALAETSAVRVPLVLAVEDVAGRESGARDVAWLMVEWLQPGRATHETWRALGGALARLHRTRAASYGWPAANFIGSLPQPNGWFESWPAFWRERRLEPQLRQAYERGHFSGVPRHGFERLLARLDELLAGAERDGASLLHGDLWSGNVHALADGSPALVDPASYYGHREVDLAMSELFGGFGPEFYEAYDDGWPIDAAYYDVRRAIYQLYFLLVHVNLFGGSYVGGALRALAATGA